jgi:hypothetical protein
VLRRLWTTFGKTNSFPTENWPEVRKPKQTLKFALHISVAHEKTRGLLITSPDGTRLGGLKYNVKIKAHSFRAPIAFAFLQQLGEFCGRLQTEESG